MKARTYSNVLIVMSVLLVGMTPSIGGGEIIYVDASALPGGDGLSWLTAYKYLQDALNKPLTNGDEICVAAGIYRPDEGSRERADDRRATFKLINGVAIYGGFAGGESNLDGRDWETNETILSGDVGREGFNRDNSYHVVNGSETNATAVLDGFTITAGNADGYELHRFGGGMYNRAGSPAVTNCIFTSNSADIGGGMYNYHSSPTVTNCTFSENSSVVGGGGMCNGVGSPTVTNCTFTGNSADIGGGMFNCYHGSPTVTNCTFSGNSGNHGGGGMYNSYSRPSLSNCILWGNSGRQIYNEWMSSPAVNYSCVQDWSGGGTGNISGNPLFVREPNDGGDGWGVGGNDDFGDLHLTHDSPCIDAGDNDSLPVDAGDLDGDGNITEPIPWDLDGRSRCVDNPATSDTGNGVPPIVDMGAYEHQRPPVYVDTDATGANNGTSWADAFKYLQDALYKPPTSGEIWVAAGTYKPDANSANPGGTGEREATFQLISGVAIYGGFAGGERSLSERDWTSNVTILSGDLNGNDIDVNDLSSLWDEPTRAENSYQIVTGSGTDAMAVLDGFSITAGNAVGQDPYYYGGGMYNDSGSPTVTNCIFSTNSAEYEGGGMYNVNSSPTVTNCTFSFNAAGDYGGGMENYDNSSPKIIDCNFIGNWAGYFGGGMENWDDSNATVINCKFINNFTYEYGGGMDNIGCDSTVINCTFIDNEGDYGGGMYNSEYSFIVINCTFIGNEGDYGGMFNEYSSLTATNCTFSGNSGYYGGGMYNYESDATVINCTFSGNSADYEGSGMYNEDSTATVTNCILWANRGAQIYHTGSGSTTVHYSDVQGGWSGTGNINADPFFIDPNGPDGIGGTADDNLRLSTSSPCIDVGDNNSVPADNADLDGDGNVVEPIPWDLDGQDRFIDGDCNDTEIVDMGAYEFSWVCFGDFDGDCDVDFADFAILTYYRVGDESLLDIAPPPNCDSIVGKRDLGILCDNWLLSVE